MSSHSLNGEKSPPYFITEPLRSFSPIKLENGDLRMAIAKAEQSAYNAWGDKATLTEEFLSRDYKTWEGGLVSINHEQNQPWVKATIHDLEYDSEKQLVICSFSGIPDWLSSLIYSADYRGLSQECVPIEMRKNSMDVVKGYGTGVTIVTDPYEPAANQGMGVGIPPALAAILASKYPTQTEDTMTNNGGGTPAITTEAYESIVSEKVELKSQLVALESENKKIGEELASTRKQFDEYKSGEADRTKVKIEDALRAYDAQVKADEARAEVVRELKSVMKEEDAETVLSTNPSIETIKSFVAIRKVELSKGVGSSLDSSNDENSEDVFRLVSELRGTRQVVR
jgi:hypothetical protein